ncbi:MAG TPA: carboxypeptidase-like regulatory domain-containing protein [Bryobacteraceae bacterium]|nr:carboxypeptidase-like regulatory domain-containing protein [Bryobacteraceae bacterium]
MKTHISVSGVVFGLVCLAAAVPASAAVSVRLSGVIAGSVTNGGGVPQMGALVMLFNQQEGLAQKAFTDEKGNFAFPGLLPDVYSIRVTLASFVPAIKNNILVQPGVRSVLNVSLAALFSSIHLVYPAEHPAFMSDDWKWVLRTAASTRPVMRLLPSPKGAPDKSDTSDEVKPHRTVFSDTRGLVMFSAGDGTPVAGFGSDADMGTAFALATSLFGSNQFQFAGNVGSGAQSGIPSAAFRTTYSRAVGSDSPEVSVTMRELFLPGQMGVAIFGPEGDVPMLRSISVDFDDHVRIGDALSMQYGMAFDSVSFNDHLSYFSPYARFIYSLGTAGDLEFAYTSGNAHPDLGAPSGTDDPLQREIGTLALFPLVSLRAARADVQRGEDLETGYSRTLGSRKFGVTAYHESIDNLALTIAAPNGFLPVGDILPDFFSGTAMFNAGNFSSMGYIASATQNVGDNLSATVMYGSTGALTADRGDPVSGDPAELRAMLHSGRQQSITMRVVAASPHTGTRVVASYQVADSRYSVPEPIYATGSLRPQPGLNIYVRQAIPILSNLPWRMEATADLRNLLQQGYLPLSAADGSSLVLMENPRMFRGGLSFIF